MAFKEHEEFLAPDDANAKIWRYMDLAKFLSILDRRELYFSRLDKLSKFDPFEGYYTNLNVLFEKIKFEDMPNEWKESTGIKDPKRFKDLVHFFKQIRELVKYHREITFVNCWHMKEHESAAMWNLYLNNNERIAIQSTYQRLIDALADYEDFEVHIGKIKYIDYNKQMISMRNTLSPFLYKRKSFENEDELRLLIWTPQHGKNDVVNPENNKYKKVSGLYVPVDLKALIEKVYIAPNAPQWIVQMIASLVKKYDLKMKVVQSDLTSTPLY